MKEQWMQKTVVVWFLAMICCLLWGSAFPCIKIGYKMLLGTSGNFKLKKTEIPMAMTLAVFQTILQYVFFYMGLAHATGVKSSIINGANSFLVIIIASLIFHQEKLTGPKILGCIIGFAGVVLVNLGGAGLDMSFYSICSVFIGIY